MVNGPLQNADTLTDEQLVRLSLQDEEHFYFLMKRYEQKILRYIRRMTSASREGAEDLLQEIFIKIYRNLNAFDPERKFSTWAYRIAHNEIVSHHRRQIRREGVLIPDDGGNDGRSLIDFLSDTLDIQETYLSRENSLGVRQAIAELPPKYGEVLVLHYFEEMSYKEISEILRKPVGSVATRISRAKSKFREIAKRRQLDCR